MTYHYNLASLFQTIAKNYSSNIAIRYPDKTYNYAQVDTISNQFAAALVSQGLKRGDVIAIINSKEHTSYILMITCIKLGIIYTNIDPDIPAERLRYTLELCQPKRIFTDHSCSMQLIESSHGCGFKIENINNLKNDSTISSDIINTIIKGIDGDAIAYIMFTSGSTGKPKGVAITHQNLLHFIEWGITHYGINSQDRFANVSPMYFDNSVFDFYISLFSGACIVPIKKSVVAAPKQLVDHVNLMECTIWFSVPSLLIFLMTMRVLTIASFASIRIITFGGEGYPKNELKKLFDLYSHRIRFVNVYGPTECTCICSNYDITEQDFMDLTQLAPLGRINPNFSYIIQNEDGELAQEGELCLLGPNVGKGYYNNPDATIKGFVLHTGAGHYNSKMYRTGDIVAIRNNLLHFIGRKDNQVKHMGYRIELEEIELAIATIAQVNQVAVIYERSNTAYGKIIAYVASMFSLETSDIQEKISKILPTYMMPNKIILMKDLPKNPNGKIDKTKLSHTDIMKAEIEI